MTTASAISDRRPVSIRQVVLASFIGTTVEWYDFFIYGTSAALVFNKLFFPRVDPLIGTLSSYGTFFVGFLARPLGGIIFGHFGDRVGRKAMLVWSLVLMGIATTLIGFVPTYDAIGIWAPVLLTVLRFAQGVGVGGEWGGAVLMAVEHSGGPRRGFHASWPQMGVPAGSLLSTGMFALFSSTLSEQQFLSWGWRLPFLLSAVLIAVGLFIRLRILETPAFAKLKENRREAKTPLVEVFRRHPREVVLGLGMRFAQNAMYYIYTVFVLSYGERSLGYPKSTMLGAVAVAAALGLFSIPLWAHLSDKIGRRPVYLAGAIFSMLFALPFFLLMQRGSPALVVVALVLGMNVGHDLTYGPQAAYFAELFSTGVRYSGASLIYQLASLWGGLAPLLATLLLAKYGIVAVAAYLSASCAVTVVATLLAPETHRREIG